MKKILIADDNIIKYFAIKRVLEVNGICDIVYVRNQEAVWEEIKKSEGLGKPIDLIISDVNYPLSKGGEANPEAGFILLKEMKKRKPEIPVLLCSSQKYNTVEAFGCVWYHKEGNWESDLKEILQKIEKQGNKI